MKTILSFNQSRETLIRISALLLFLVSSLFCSKAPKDNSADLAFEKALAEAKSSQKLLIVQFTADWCPDCQALDKILKSEKLGSMLQERAILLPVDVGRFDQNLDLSEKLGNPIKNGIPAVVTILPKEPFQIIASTKGGEFSEARSLGESQVYEYFRQILY